MSKGKKAVYLGYKTTKNREDAITDLAVMNMKGGYKTKNYDSLMKDYLNCHIIPFVENFASAIKEYRENYTSDNKANQKRAQAVHDMLNKLTDDDTGKKLGDLLLNETKYEMGDDAYNALSDAEKKNHADIVTIIAQANGQATLMLENLLTRASDTNDDTWLDRFSATTYDDLIDATGKTPTDAKRELAKLYDDDANKIVDHMWVDFKKALEGYDGAAAYVNSYDIKGFEAAADAYDSLDENTAESEKEAIVSTYLDELEKYNEFKDDLVTVSLYEKLSDIDYGEGTMADFFTQDQTSDDFDVACVYPMVTSLTDGQRSGLDFVSLKELCAMAMTDEDSYEEINTDEIPEASVYDGVNRAIYEKGGVGLTSDAIRTDAAAEDAGIDKSRIGTVSIIMYSITGACAVAFVSSAVAWSHYAKTLRYMQNSENLIGTFNDFGQDAFQRAVARTASSTTLCKGLTIGFGVAMTLLAAVSLYFTFKDMRDYYQTDFTPQPRFIVEESDITDYNKNGDKIVVKNQTAYYQLAETNRGKDAEFYNVLGTGNDLNGDVGKQWLSLYYVKNAEMKPILADSIKAVAGSTEIPAGYETGIHLFGEDTAYNLNNPLYVWNDSADSVTVYFSTESSHAS